MLEYSNDIPTNKAKKHDSACKEDGSKDLCDDLTCDFDKECRSGCCSQVLTKGFKRCAAMLVGDYCPRALDPIHEMLEAQHQLHASEKALHHEVVEEALKEEVAVPAVVEEAHVEPAALPCNVFGTVDRCDGMACEHDGNCFSGCCSLFVSGEHKRCMPLVGDGLCPIAIDIVDHGDVTPAIDAEIHDILSHEDFPEDVVDPVDVDFADPDDSPLHYIDHKELSPIEEEQEKHEDKYHSGDYDDLDEDLPMIEKTEHHEFDMHDLFDDEEDHFILEKSEHAYMEDDDRIEDDHFIPEKVEHHAPDVHDLPRDRWEPDFHGHHGIADDVVEDDENEAISDDMIFEEAQVIE